MKIPKIIHQSWKSEVKDLPAKESSIKNILLKNHPEWQYQFWTDEDNFNLIADYYPWFLDTYESYEWPIQRADAARVFYMHKYGGIYLDLDMLSLKPMDEMIDQIEHNDCQFLLNCSHNREVILFEEYPNAYNLQNSIYNAILASEPNSRFWILAAYMMQQRALELKYKRDMQKQSKVFWSTGPQLISAVVTSQIQASSNHSLCVLPYFYTNPTSLPGKNEGELVLFNKFNVSSLFKKSDTTDGGWQNIPKQYLVESLLPDSYFTHESSRTWA